MAKFLCALFVAVCIVVAKGADLKCYQCQKCAQIPNGSLMTCKALVTTTEPIMTQSTTTKPTTIAPVTTSTLVPGTTPTPNPGTTPTLAPETTPVTDSEAPPTTSPATPPTVAPDAPLTTSDSGAPPTTSAASLTTPTANQEVTPSPTEIAPESIQDVASGTASVFISPQESAAAISSPYQQLPPRLSRQTLAYGPYVRSVRQVSTTIDYSCFYHEYKDTNGHTVVDRGCTQNLNECDGKENCKLCKEDGCNNSSMLHVSVWTTLLATVVIFVMLK